jgi:hypothetical protein
MRPSLFPLRLHSLTTGSSMDGSEPGQHERLAASGWLVTSEIFLSHVGILWRLARPDQFVPFFLPCDHRLLHRLLLSPASRLFSVGDCQMSQGCRVVV